MKSFLKSFKRQDGFTLVELMVVVAIIGVLSAVAIPNFKKYQAKAKTSEAKLQLAAAYTAQQSFYSDFDTYGLCLAYMGFNPVNEASQRLFAVGFGTGTTPSAAVGTLLSANGASGCGNTVTANSSYFAAGKAMSTAAAIASFAVADIGTSAAAAQADPQTFVIGAVGVVDMSGTTASTAASFSMNEDKKLIQVRAGY